MKQLLVLLLVLVAIPAPADAASAPDRLGTEAEVLDIGPDVAALALDVSADTLPGTIAPGTTAPGVDGSARIVSAEGPEARGSTEPDAPGAGGLLGLIGSVLAMAALGTVINLRTTDANGNRQSHRLDSEADDFGERMEDYRLAVEDEARRPLQTNLSAAETARDSYRDMVIDEIVRVETLAHTDKDGKLSEDFKAEDERAFLETLTPEKLELHFKKARTKTVDLSPQSSSEEPTADEAAFGHVTVH